MRSDRPSAHRRSLTGLAAVAAAGMLIVGCASEASPTATQVVSRPVTLATATPPPTSLPPTAVAPTSSPATPPPATAPAVPSALQLGPGLHDFKLPDAQGGEVQLSQYLGEKNVILVFYRAWW